ncbi:MAG TPA: HAMP domain-containing sensor histidine kinase [Solirubrobacteraceae bacterium]|nr:HAMP domain-containing sensor histidine kinase [Solirubrobacteraceae bacterium]
MTATAALCGWIAAGIAVALALAVRHALDERREAVARACHELRGPLTAARLGLSMPLVADDASQARLRAIDAELCRASLALEDLAVARRGLRLQQIERIDVTALAAEAVRAAQGRAHAAGATVTLAEAGAGGGFDRGAPPAMVWGDRLRLAQALGNLIANAIEHGGPDVSVRVLERAGGVRVEVVDSGSGLPAPVAQLARRARRGRGTRGRGLAIALQIARSHGGTVAAAPVRAGARVVLELPSGAAMPRRRRTR